MNDYRLFWLHLLDDESLAAAASVIAGVPLRTEYVEAVARARRELLPRRHRLVGDFFGEEQPPKGR